MASPGAGTDQIAAEGILVGVGCVHSDQANKNIASNGESDMHQELLRIEAQVASSDKQPTQEHSGSTEGQHIRNSAKRAPLSSAVVINPLNHDDLSPDSTQPPEMATSVTLKSCEMGKVKEKDVGKEQWLEENWSIAVQRSERSDK
jgi:hypothetical protein